MPGIAADVEAEIERHRLSMGQAVDLTLVRPFVDDLLVPVGIAQIDQAPLQQQISQIITFGAAYERYINDPTHRWTVSTRQTYETSRRLAISVIGADVPISSIARAQCREYLDVLRFLPRNAAKLFPKLTARQASQRAQADGDIEIISAANANANLANLSSFLTWAVNEELLARNPMRGLRLPDEVAKRDKRLPFSAEQLRSIFDAPLYRGCVDGDRGYAKPGDEHPRNARFWVPLIALHTGMRLNEICQLDVADVRVVDGVRCFAVCDTSLLGDSDKTLKTAASSRLVPIHHTLIDCGLLLYVEKRRQAKEIKLFGEIDPGSRGKRSIAFSKWFTQFTRSCGAYRPRTCFHSFRHNFRDELRAARIDADVVVELCGWTGVGRASTTADAYGSGPRVSALHSAIAKLTFAHVDLSHLISHGR